MSKSRTIGIAAVCAAVGAAGGIAGTTAATSRHKQHGSRQTGAAPGPGRPWGDHRGPGGPAVHEEAVVLDKAGKSWITVTEDSGKVKSVSGNDVTIAEGTDSVPYRDVTVTIPNGATVMRDGAQAAVSDLKADDFVHVSSSSDGTFVFAADASWRPAGPWGHGDHGDGDHGGGPPPGGPGDWGPPPGSNR